MVRRCLQVLAVAALCACAPTDDPPIESLPAFVIDSSRVTVSGVSSGAYMAGQLHVARSELFSGAALIGGGPWRCAQGEMGQALGPCMQGGDLDIDSLAAFATAAANDGRIDALENLADDQVWVFHGARDSIMHVDTATSADAWYARWIADSQRALVTDVPATHGLPALGAAAGCEEFAEPYLNDCGYDAAGEWLGFLYGELEPRATATSSLMVLPQPDADAAGMLPSALLYAPQSCRDGAACGLHIVLHGCRQSTDFVGERFAAGAGLNEWAESNRLLVLYPQVDSSRIAPINPNGCWDWWGYTGDDYASKDGKQLRVILKLLDSLAGSAP